MSPLFVCYTQELNAMLCYLQNELAAMIRKCLWDYETLDASAFGKAVEGAGVGCYGVSYELCKKSVCCLHDDRHWVVRGEQLERK